MLPESGTGTVEDYYYDSRHAPVTGTEREIRVVAEALYFDRTSYCSAARGGARPEIGPSCRAIKPVREGQRDLSMRAEEVESV